MDESQERPDPTPTPPPPRSRWLKWIGAPAALAALAFTLAASFGVGAWVALRIAVRRSPEITTPSVVGQDAANAEEQLRRVGLTPEVAGRRYDPAQPEGKVLSQIPVAGGATRPGRPVRLVVSLGSRRSAVPDLVGSSQVRATLALRAAGLDLSADAQAPDRTLSAGRVLGQHPPAGAAAAPGEKVALLLSAGPLPAVYVMPDLLGRPAPAVAAALGRAGFQRVRLVGAHGENQPRGPVSGQDPKAGWPVSVDDAVTLTVASG